MDHLNQHSGMTGRLLSLETLISGDEGQNEGRPDKYHPVQMTQDVSGFLNKQIGFHSKPPKLSLFSREEVPGKHED